MIRRFSKGHPMVEISDDHGAHEGLFSETRVLGLLIVAMVFGFGLLVGHAL
jgi:hypothetical protein